jgi:glycosyltransferase involved in cell wall biosynthesis
MHIITKSNPLGGAQRYVLDLAVSGKEHGHEVYVVVGGEGPLVEKLRAAGIEVRTIASMGRDISPLKDLETLKALRAIIKEIRPDVLQLNSAKASGLAAFAARTIRYPKSSDKNTPRRPRIVFTAHGWAFNEERSLWQRLAILFFSWLTIALCDITIAVSIAMTRPFVHLPFASSRMRIVYIGVKEFQPLSKEAARETFMHEGIDLSVHKFVVGMLAELHPIKGIEYAIRAVASLPDVALVVCGEGEERSKLETLIDELKVRDRVYLPGYVADARMRLRAFDACLISSTSEALSYAVLEAGYAGVPTIGTEVGGIPEAVGNDTGYLIAPRSLSAIAAAITAIRSNPIEAIKKAERQKERVHHAFTQEIMTSETLAVLTQPSLLSRQRKQR